MEQSVVSRPRATSAPDVRTATPRARSRENVTAPGSFGTCGGPRTLLRCGGRGDRRRGVRRTEWWGDRAALPELRAQLVDLVVAHGYVPGTLKISVLVIEREPG